MSTVITSMKRSLDNNPLIEGEVDEEECGTSELGGNNPSNSFLQPSTTTNFLPYHLKILRSLYNDKNTTSNDNHTSINHTPVSDENVSEDVWTMIERFLAERHELRQVKLQANHWRSIADECSCYLQENRLRQDTNHQYHQHPLQRQLFRSPASCQPRPSPIEKRLFGSPYRSSMSLSAISTKSHSLVTSNRQEQLQQNRGLVLTSKILNRRARVAEHRAQQVVHPYQDLYLAVCNRSKRLDSLVSSSSNSTDTLMTSPKAQWNGTDPCSKDAVAGSAHSINGNLDRSIEQQRRNELWRNSMYEVDAKSRLWKKLANDLYSAIQI